MRHLYFILLFLLPMVAVGQNLVPNPSFEEYTWCSNFNQGSGWALNWIIPDQGLTPDYYNSCSSVSGASVPENGAGQQLAQDGNAYIGLYAYSNEFEDVREFITILLADTLSEGERYVFSCYFSLSDESIYSVAKIGGVLTSEIPIGPDPIHSIIPHMVNQTPLPLFDKINWINITDTITAVGNERYLTIGCVVNDSIAEPTYVGDGNLNFDVAYYYVDNVSLVSLDTILSLGIMNPISFEVYPNPAIDNITIESQTPVSQVKLTDISGRTVWQETLRSGQRNKTIDVSGLPSGIYLVEAITKDGRRSVQKVVVE